MYSCNGKAEKEQTKTNKQLNKHKKIKGAVCNVFECTKALFLRKSRLF